MSYDEPFDDDDFGDLDEDALIEEIMAMEGRILAEVERSAMDADYAAETSQEIEKPDIAAVIAALRGLDDGRPGATILYGLSDLTGQELDAVLPVWNELASSVQRDIVRALIESSEAFYRLTYQALGLRLLDSDDPRVRQLAIELVWEDETVALMWRLAAMAEQDSNHDVRAAAASALGRFILLGEYEDLPEQEVAGVIDILIRIWQDESADVEVRRRVLEALSNSTHDIVPSAITTAYNSTYMEMRVSAVFAMGRTADKRWQNDIMQEIDSDEGAMRYEAARAAGELAIIEAVPKLAEMTIQPDRELAEVAIWSLGEIGGRSAMRVLEMLMEKAEEDGDLDLIDSVEDAMGNAMLASELDDLDDLDF